MMKRMSSGVLALSLLWAGVLTPSHAQNVPCGTPIKIELAKQAAGRCG